MERGEREERQRRGGGEGTELIEDWEEVGDRWRSVQQ